MVEFWDVEGIFYVISPPAALETLRAQRVFIIFPMSLTPLPSSGATGQGRRQRKIKLPAALLLYVFHRYLLNMFHHSWIYLGFNMVNIHRDKDAENVIDLNPVNVEKGATTLGLT